MKAERIVLSFIALLAGLLVAGIAFYLFQTTKTITPTKMKIVKDAQPSTTPSPVLLTLDDPKDQDVFDSKIVTVSGKTEANATIIISTESSDQVITPASNGSFTTTVTIDSGQNYIEVTAITPNGQEATIKRTVTYSTETF